MHAAPVVQVGVSTVMAMPRMKAAPSFVYFPHTALTDSIPHHPPPAAFNPVDKYVAAGYFAERSPIFKMPRSVGSDFAGIVVAIGAGAKVASLDPDGALVLRDAQIGDAVYGDGIAGTGSFAEFVSVLGEQAVLKPPELSFAEAACLGLAGLTAYQCLTQHATTPVGPGSKVLVLGGTGGVGSMAVQIAKALGATVAATGSKVDLLESLGADVTINYREQDWSEVLAGQDYDLVFATVNDATPLPAAERALAVLGPTGSFHFLLESIKPADDLDLGGRKFEFFLTNSKDHSSLAKIGAMAAKGTIKAVLHNGQTFPFNAEGWGLLMAESNSGRAKGKLVMKMDGK